MKKANSLFLKFTIGVGFVLLIGCMAGWLTGCSSSSQTKTEDLKQENGTVNNEQVLEEENNILEGEINISTYHEDTYLELAAKKYQETHEGVTIHVNVYQSRTDGSGADKSKDKYMQIVNTSLVSGKGDDIIDMYPISYFKLADKNMLVDLNEYLGSELNGTEYYMSILDAYLYKGKRYTVPISFLFDGYSVNKETEKSFGIETNGSDLTLESLLSFSDTLPKDKKAMLFDDSGFGMEDMSLAYLLFSLDLDEFIDMETMKVDINNEHFMSILEGVSRISENKQIITSRRNPNEESFYTDGTKSLINCYGLYTPAMCHNGTLDYADLNLKLVVNEEGQSTFDSFSFRPAINNNSKNKALAADFIKFLLSEEMQSSTELLFCPVNKNAVKETSQLIYEQVKAEGYLPEGFDEKNLESNIHIFNELAEKTTRVSYLDMNIRDFVMDEMTLYFAGQETAAQAAKNLQTKLNTYLKE